MCWHYMINSYDYYCHLLRSNIRYWQELLIILTGCLSFIGYIVHITNNDIRIGGKMVVYVCGPLFVITCCWYCCKQFEWKIMKKYFLFQSRPLSLLLSTLLLMIMDIITSYSIYDDPTLHIIFSTFYSFAIFVFIGMETAPNVSLILYIFYPLTICVACFINIIRSFYWETIIIDQGNIHHFSLSQIDRLLQGQICISTFIVFLFAINNPSRKYYILFTKPISRFNIVHESTKYESMKKFSLLLQITWVLISIILLICEYTQADIKYYTMDYGIVIVLILNTLILIYIEFDWKVLNRLLFSQRCIILIICMIALFIAETIVLQHVVITNDFILVSLNEYFWIFGIMYMIFVDGFRNARCWHRLFVYAIYIFKSITLVLRTMFDWIDINLYPETKDWFKNNPKQTQIIDNIDRFSWYFVGGIALISILNVLYDPSHQYFVMNIEKLCRNKKITRITRMSSPGMSPIINQHHHHQYHRKSSKYNGSLGGSSVIGSNGIGGGLVIEVETDDDTTSGVHHSLITDITTSTYNTSDIGYRTLLKMDL